VAEIEAKFENLKNGGVSAAHLVDPMTQAARTFPLGPAHGRSAASEYKLLLSREKVERAEPQATPVPVQDAGNLLQVFRTEAFFPPGSEARLFRTGFVNCHQATCELVLNP